MKELPLLYSTPMVQAVLEERKTQTRRTRGLKTLNEEPDRFELIRLEINPTVCSHSLTGNIKTKQLAGNYAIFEDPKTEKSYFIKCPYGQAGDLLWVRETWSEEGFVGNYIFKADGVSLLTDDDRWHPSIHMPKEAARIWLQVEEIRIERLHDISEEDAIAEGVQSIKRTSGVLYMNYSIKEYVFPYSAKKSFQSLWYSINGEESWKQNPWVWVVKFKTLSTTGKPHPENHPELDSGSLSENPNIQQSKNLQQ